MALLSFPESVLLRSEKGGITTNTESHHRLGRDICMETGIVIFTVGFNQIYLDQPAIVCSLPCLFGCSHKQLGLGPGKQRLNEYTNIYLYRDEHTLIQAVTDYGAC